MAFLPAQRRNQPDDQPEQFGSNTLQFQVSGVTSGNMVEVLADGNPIGQATVPASSTSVTVTTNGTTTLSDGPHTITAVQIAQSKTATINENNGSGGTTPTTQTANVPSLDSPAVQVTVDTVAPTVTGVGTTAAANTVFPKGGALPITVTFSEPVTVAGTPQLALNAGSGATATYSSGTGSSTLTFTYTVAAGQIASKLDYASTTALSLGTGGSIADAADNAAVLTLSAPGTGSDGLATKNLSINGNAPTVTLVTTTASAGSKLQTGASIPILIAFSEPVTVTGTPQLALNVGAGATATYFSGSGSATLTFTYTVAAGQSSSKLDYSATAALSGGTIKDAAGNAGVLALPTPGTASDGLATQSLAVNGLTPSVTAVSPAWGPAAGGTTVTITGFELHRAPPRWISAPRRRPVSRSIPPGHRSRPRLPRGAGPGGCDGGHAERHFAHHFGRHVRIHSDGDAAESGVGAGDGPHDGDHHRDELRRRRPR